MTTLTQKILLFRNLEKGEYSKEPRILSTIHQQKGEADSVSIIRYR